MMAAPIVWVGLEYGRAYFLSGFPWYYLAHSQFRHLYLIQIADFASSLGISLLDRHRQCHGGRPVDASPVRPIAARNPIEPPAVRAALRGDVLAGDDALLRSDPGLERAVR